MPADPHLPIFEHTQTIAIVGLSPKPERDSHHVAQYLQAQGFRIVPINPAADEVLGERCWPSLTEAAKHHRIDLVDVFRDSAAVPRLPTKPSPLAPKRCGCKLACATMPRWPKPRRPGWRWCKTTARWWSTSGCGLLVCCHPIDAGASAHKAAG